MKARLKGLSKAAVLYISALAWAPAFLLPYDVPSSMQRFGLSEEHAGWLASCVLLLVALSAMIVGRRVGTLDKRRYSLVSCAVGLLAITGVAVFNDFYIVSVLKGILGIALGVLIACTYAVMSMDDHPEKVFAELTLTMAILYGAVMFSIPFVTERVGVKGTELVEIAMFAIGVLIAFWMPVAKISDAAEAAIERGISRSTTICEIWILVSIFATFVMQTAAMSFAELAGQTRGIDAHELGTILMIQALLQFPAGILARSLGDRAGFYKPIYAALFVLFLVSIGMYCQHNRSLFIVATCLVNAAATVAFPFSLGLLANLDESGRSSAMAGSVSNIGLALGPAAGGFALAFGGLQGVGWMSAGVIVLGIIAITLASRKTVSGQVRAEAI
ncbi:MFS transporter [Paraburkholderia sp.]|uniref:MFS transporter n=1 Tax=Paraburkholderia sp. TaxID=1926495 RepID=UPI0025D3E543|nr:MFS transporter [Paraburkholderia sp.]